MVWEATEVEAMSHLHYRPPHRWVGDLIPFFWQGEYHLFYLPRAPEQRHCWGHLVSRDLITWTELPDALTPSNIPEAPDAVGCWTGSVIAHDGVFHCFYTGFNPHSPFPQTVCHAISDDLVRWRKDPANPVVVPDERWYEPQDWRDPFVLYNPEAGEFWMLICARDKRVLFERRGCVALATSPDLQQWQVKEPLWSGSVCWAAECPDLFCLDNRWFLVYSHGVTRYRWASRLGDVWQAPFPDTFDTEFVAAAKTLFDGKRQLLFGWIGTLEGERDTGPRQWGGHMALPRELRPQPDGRLAVRLPEEWVSWQENHATFLSLAQLQSLCGMWHCGDEEARVDASNGVAVAQCPAPADFWLRLTVIPEGQTAEFGFLLRMENGRGHKLSVTPSRIALHRWSSWGDPEPRLALPFSWRAGEPLTVHLIVHGSIVEMFVDERVSFAGRVYEPPQGWLGFYAANGPVRFQFAAIAPLPPLL